MKFAFEKQIPASPVLDAYVIPVRAGKEIGNLPWAKALLDLVDEERFAGKAGDLLKLETAVDGKVVSCVFAGLGENPCPKSTENAYAKAVKEAKKSKAATIGIIVDSAEPGKCAEAVLLADDTFDAHKEKKSDPVDYTFFGADEAALKEGIVLGEAVRLTRSLVNEPSNVMTPAKLATEALIIGADSGFDVVIYDLAEIEKLGMKAFLEVGRGSDRTPKVIAMEYKGNPGSDDKIGLVGKGICYDSGGFSLKPSGGMVTMHTDMGGAAAVIGAMSAIAKMGLKINVSGVVAACENILSDHAYHPGDIIGSMAGKTIEVNNTDAEGRITLADAVTFAIEKQGAKKIIDIATLTGGAIVAFGSEITAVVCDNEELWQKAEKAAIPACEKVWRLPADEELGKALDSKIADVRNSSGRGASTICGGLFIQKFAQGLPWMHLDIAGTSYTTSEKPTCSFGATGVGARLLYHTVKNSL